MTKNKFLSKRLACLLTSALIASPTFVVPNFANAAALTLSANSTQGSNGINGNATLAAGDTVTMTTFNLSISNALDLSAAAIGAITATTGTLTFTSSGTSAGVSQLATSFVSTPGTANLAVTTAAASDKAFTVTFSGDVTPGGNITLTGDTDTAVITTLAIAGDVTGSAILDDTATKGTTVLKMTGTAKTLTGTIEGSAAGEGEFQTTGTTTVTGAVGATNRLATVNIDADTTFNSSVAATTIDIATTKTATIKGNVTTTGTANALNLYSGSGLTLSGTSAQTVSANIIGVSASGNGLGTITVSNSEGVTFSNAIGAATTQVLSLVTSGTGKVTMGAANNFVDKIVIGDGTTLVLSKAITNGSVVFRTDSTAFDATAIAAAIDGTTTAPLIYLPANLKGGQTIDLIQSVADPAADFSGSLVGTMTALVTDLNTGSILKDNALSDYTASAATGVVTITSNDKSAAQTASELGVNTNKASALLQARDAAAAANAAGTDTSTIDAIYNVLNAQSGQSATADTKLAKQVSPQTDVITGSTIAAKAVTSGVQNVIATRLASLRSGDAYSTGVVTGNHMGTNSGFIQAFGSTVEQKNKGNEFGYDADTTGFAIGFDTKIPGGAVIGISYAHSKADVDGKGTGKAKNDIKTDSVSLYADYATKAGYVEGSITYGKSDNKGSRIVNSADLDRTYKSNYDGEQYSFRLSGGIPQSLGGGAFITPFAGATISQIKADAYTETSTTADDTLRLRVAQDTVDSQVGTVGVKYHQVIKDGKTTFTPEVKLAVNQEFGDGNITTTNTYQGGGASFKNSTAIERTSATAGLGLNISSDNVSFNIGYEADVKDKYLGHSAQAKITAKF